MTTRTERHIIVEYGPPLRLDVGETAVAAQLAQQFKSLSRKWGRQLGLPEYVRPFEAEAKGSVVRVKAKGVTGILSVGQFEIVVAPKYLKTAAVDGDPGWERALAALVAVGTGARHLIDGTVSAQAATAPGFVELFARSYASALQAALDQGLPRHYRLRRERLPVVRGRVVVEQLYPRILYAPHELPVEYPDYIDDTPINRLLRWAAEQFSRLPVRARTAGQLTDLAARMRGIAPELPDRSETDRIRLAPQHQHLAPALQLARWLASGRYGAPGAGRASVPGLLLHSDRVFEAFVLAVVRAAGRRAGYQFRRAEHEMASPTAASHAIPTEPDGELLLGDDVACVLDAKYKTWKKHPKTTDVYQVLAGARVLAAPEAALIYPAPRRRPPQTWTVVGDGNPEEVHAWFVAPMALAEPGGYAGVVDALLADLTATLRPTSIAA